MKIGNPSIEGKVFELIDGMPQLIQAGMGVRVSSANLANHTSRLGALGVVSSVGIRHIVIDEIRSGDPIALELAKSFPLKDYVDELLEFAPGNSKNCAPVPLDDPDPRKGTLPKRLSAICAYIEVMRAKMGHCGKVGVNVMWKCALTVLPSIYGAMIAGVDALLCGAGVPMELPDIVKKIKEGKNLEYLPLHGTGTNAKFDISKDGIASILKEMPFPHLIPILSNFAFPKRIMDVWHREFNGTKPFAFVLEHHRAGGHNAPPRNKESFGEQDDINTYYKKVIDLGVPVYIAGAGDTCEDFLYWISKGAYGLQIGSRFALCDESGMRRDLKDRVLEQNGREDSEVQTSNRLSPTGYPFKYLPLPGTLSDSTVYDARKRVCNKGYLLQTHIITLPDGTEKETYICAAMPEKQYDKLGGDLVEQEGRVCLCNALFSTAGAAAPTEPPLITLGANGARIKRRWTAREVLEDILTLEFVASKEKELAISF